MTPSSVLRCATFFMTLTLTAVCHAEIPAYGPLPFATIDENGDGYITADEFDRAHEKRNAQRAARGGAQGNAMNRPAFEDLDLNGDGRLDANEWTARRPTRMNANSRMNPPAFDEFDLDGDGMISPKEFHTARGEHQKSRILQGGMLRNAPYAPAFADIDTNGDNLISEEEWNAHQMNRRGSRRQ